MSSSNEARASTRYRGLKRISDVTDWLAGEDAADTEKSDRTLVDSRQQSRSKLASGLRLTS